jgi:RecB family exonuclease
MLPSLSSSDLLLDMLSGERGFFGERPDIWSWSEMYSRLVPEKELRRQIDPPDHRLILKYVLDSNIEELDGRGAYVPSGARRRGFIDILSLSIRELLLEGVAPDMILGAAGLDGADGPDEKRREGGPHRDLLYRLYTDYLLYLEENGLADNSQIPSLLSDSLGRGLPEYLDGAVLCWIGFLSFTGSQLRLVKTLRRLGQDMEFFMPETGLEGFHDISSQLGDDAKTLGPRGGAMITLKARDAYAQYERIASEIAGASRGHGALRGLLSNLIAPDMLSESLEDIGVLVSRECVPFLVSALEKHGVPHQRRSETPVSETRSIELAKRAWETYRLGWPARHVTHLLCTVGAAEQGENKENKSARNRSYNKPGQMPCFPPSGLDAWREALAGDPPRLNLLERLSAFCRYIDEDGGHSPEGLLRALLELCGEGWEARLGAEAGDDESVDPSVRALASSRLELEQKIRMLSEITPPLGEAGRVRFRGDEAMGFLRDWASHAATALPQPTRGAVSLYDSPPPVLLSHKIWIMADVDPVRYSGQSSEQPLLDEKLRGGVNKFNDSGNPDERDVPGNSELSGGLGAVHLPTLREKREQKEAMFRRLMSLGERVTVVARSELDSQCREQGDSPFILSMLAGNSSGLSKSPEWIVAGEISGEPETAGSRQPAASRGKFPRSARSAARGVVGESTGKQKLRVSASAIDDFADCPFSYWCGHIAKFETPKDETGIFDRMLQGSLVHDIWLSVWNIYLARGRSQTLHSLLMAEWGNAETALEGKYPGLRDSAAAAVTADLRSVMAQAAVAQDEAEARAAAAGLERESTEFEFRLPPYETENITFTGRADRIDVWKGTGAVILDYKLGSSDKYKNSLQLAYYAAMISDAGLPVAGFGYIGHSDGKIRGAWSPDVEAVYKGQSRTRDEGLDAKIALALESMAEIDRVAASGEFMANYDSGRCPKCHWSVICRRSERGGFYDSPDDSDVPDQNIL